MSMITKPVDPLFGRVKPRLNSRRKFVSGFSMIEVLIAILVLAVGLLGLSAMQLTSLKVNQGAYYRTQASILAADILDRMRANRDAFLAGNYDDLDTSSTIPANQACISSVSGCSASELATQDFREWSGSFQDINGLGDDYVPLIPGAKGTVARDTTNDNATVTISWSQQGWGDDGAGNVTKTNVAEQFQVIVRI